MNIPEKWIVITTTEFLEICTDLDCNPKSRPCEYFSEGVSWNNRCYHIVEDYPDVQPCTKDQAFLYAMIGLEVRPAPGESQ